MIGAVLVAALLASRSCADTSHAVSKDEALAIAREAKRFEPDHVQIRFVRQGVPEPRGIWAISLYTQDENGRPVRVNLVRVDAETGEIVR